VSAPTNPFLFLANLFVGFFVGFLVIFALLIFSARAQTPPPQYIPPARIKPWHALIDVVVPGQPVQTNYYRNGYDTKEECEDGMGSDGLRDEIGRFLKFLREHVSPEATLANLRCEPTIRA
jgi:hypothetical protein